MDRDPHQRTERERAHHDRRFAGAGRSRRQTAKYYEVDAGRRRYLELLELLGSGDRVLELGCGAASRAPWLAARGAAVTAVDISGVAVELTARLAADAGVAIDARQMDAHALDLADGAFDVVCGSGILHHLDLDVALSEIRRVLRPGGRGVFLEPLGHNPAINLYRWATPSMRSPDEHPLTVDDLQSTRAHFATVRAEPFSLTALAAAPVRHLPGAGALVDGLHRLDRHLFRRSALARRWAWVAVVTLAEPVPRPASGRAD